MKGWYASFWRFCVSCLDSRFGEEWSVSPEQSVSLHAGNWTVPRQLLVCAPRGGNKPIGLIHDTSIFDVRLDMPPEAGRTILNGVRLYNLPAALLGRAQGQLEFRPTELRAALAMLRNPSEVPRRLLAGGHSKIAGRLAGAFRNIGRAKFADEIIGAMQAAGYSSTLRRRWRLNYQYSL